MHFWPGIVLRKQPLEASICYVSPRLQHTVFSCTVLKFLLKLNWRIRAIVVHLSSYDLQNNLKFCQNLKIEVLTKQNVRSNPKSTTTPSPSPFPKLPTSGHKVDRNSFRGQGLYFGLYFVDRGKMLPFSDAIIWAARAERRPHKHGLTYCTITILSRPTCYYASYGRLL